jgi:hypothetical protein
MNRKNYFNDYENTLYAYTKGETIAITLTSDSGRVVTRQKIDTLIGTNHPGLIMGNDGYGNLLILHLHYENNVPVIDRANDYGKNQPIFYDNRPVAFDRGTILSRALDALARGEKYDKVEHNCQQFINRIVKGVNKSEAVEKVSDGLLWGSLFVGLLGLATKNKALIITAAAMAGGGVYGKYKNQ